jgi:hypothetical protein
VLVVVVLLRPEGLLPARRRTAPPDLGPVGRG